MDFNVEESEYSSIPAHPPTHNHGDLSDYRTKVLTAGIRVCAVQHPGTSGLVVRNRQYSGARRVMLANHVLLTLIVCVILHTKSAENHRGTIVERFPDIDLALVEVDEHVKYHNFMYFDAPIAKKLVTRQYVGVKRQD